ncbi:hypothetical protein HY214_01180 [Candidatus Roizmanbacteria bacterium]|nr:hypothetical protein [Candidatus Roizmanbacteria bacterium]
MEKLIEETVKLLGLSKKETKFFVTAFKLGPASIAEIVNASRLERSTAYLIAADLIRKGFIHEDYHDYRKKLVTIEPKTLLRMIQAEERSVGRKGLELEEELPELQTLYQASAIRPKVRVYEGKKGLAQIHEDILKMKQAILLWSNQESERFIFDEDHHQAFIAERVRKGIPIRVLTIDNILGKKLVGTDEKVYRKTKILPKNVNFTAETYIYGSKVAILDYKKDIIGIIIESEPIAASQRALFEMIWNILSV